MDIEKFLFEDCIDRLKKGDANAAPKWGIMTFQHMVEHLILVTKISYGKIKLELITPEDKLPRMITFLESDAPLPTNFKAPYLPKEENIPLHFKNVSQAIDKVEIELSKFYETFKESPNEKHTHPVFGPLNQDQWEKFHKKHFTHHLSQFGLI